MSDFVHLHNHTDFSLLDGAQSVNTLIDTISDLKMSSVGITEHGNLFSMLPLYKAAQKAGVKPILGCEVYVSKGSHTERKSTRETGWGYNHLVLLAKNQIGLNNLMKLVSIGYLEGFYYRPRIDKTLLRQYSEGLICTSGCLKGEVQENSFMYGYDRAQEAALEYAEIFEDNFYLEIQQHKIPEENLAMETNIKLASELNLPLVATNDCHYARQEHWEAHDVMFCLGTGKDRDDPNRQRYATPEFYFKNVDEMYQLFKDAPQALENTVAIAEQCQAELNLGELYLPNFPIPDESGTSDPAVYLRMLVEQGLETQGGLDDERRQRIDHELQVINNMDYAGYFLIVMDFIRFARSKSIPVGPGRGSAAGSLVAYALGITAVDPLRYNLLFERFLNPDRVSMPDIDIDFCQDRRGEVIDYVKDLYGADAVCQIITFGKLKARSVVRDVGRVLGMSYGETDRIAKMIPEGPKATLTRAIQENPDLAVAEDIDDRHRELFQFSRVLEGMNRHASTHAAGVVIAPGDLTNYVPLYKHPKTGDITTQVDMNGLEDMGLLKMDFLGLRTLTVIDRAVKMLKTKGIEVDIENLPLNDQATYDLFSRGQTIGVFQFESSGMREFLAKLKPTVLQDLIAMNALYRPGPMAYIDDFIDRKHGRKKIAYLHQSLEPILQETYGIIVYQEQVMQIANIIAGFTLAQADIMRRIMGKKKVKEMAKVGEEFLEGAKNQGIPDNTAQEIYDLIARFAEYGFNKSHSTAYAVVAYQTAYLKAHYPAEFMAANLSSEMNNPTRMPILLAEARDMRLEVLPPDVNYSGRNFRVDDQGRVRFGLNAIKHVGQKAADHIRDVGDENDTWQNLPQFLAALDQHMVNRKAVECLIRSGACDSLEGTRHQQFVQIDEAVKYAHAVQLGTNTSQESLFGGASADIITEPKLADVLPWSDSEHFEMEKELTGYYLSGHPLTANAEDLKEFSNYDFTDPKAAQKLELLKLGGMVNAPKIHHTRKGLPMAFFTLEGLLGNAEVVVFSDLYSKAKDFLTKDSPIFVIGRLSNKSSNGNTADDNSAGEKLDLKILAEDIFPLDQIRTRIGKHLNIRLPQQLVDTELTKKIHDLTYANRGASELRFYIIDESYADGQGPKILQRIRSTALRVAPSDSLLANLRQLLGDKNVWLSES
jgi:DNA polymerase-3 subunit alpha